MINNKQVNIWRGDQPPPTLTHIWINNNNQLLLYNGVKWVVFLDDNKIIDSINDITNHVTTLENSLNTIINSTINDKYIRDNPVLTGDDIMINVNGNYIKDTDSAKSAIVKLDTLIGTQVIE